MKKSRKIVVLSLLLALINANMSFANEVFKSEVKNNTATQEAIHNVIDSNKKDFKRGNEYSCAHDIYNKKELYDFLMKNSLYHNLKVEFNYCGKEDYDEIREYLKWIVNKSHLCTWNSSITVEEIDDKYILTAKPYAKDDKLLYEITENVIERWLKQNIKENMTEEDIVKTIHDFLIRSSHYEYTESGIFNGFNIYTAPSILLGHGGVCCGYADAFDRMARMAGLDTYVLIGDAGGPHAWNMVKVDNEWKHIDVTNDGTTLGFPTYQYFLLNDTQIEHTHAWDSQSMKNY